MEQFNQDLNDMAIFAEIATTGGISSAAAKIGLPKSNVSRRLARLEGRLGVRLLERNTRTRRLTPVGERYADFCRAMLEEAKAADAFAAQALEKPSGTLRVSASVLMGQFLLMPVIAEYVRECPDVDVSVSLANYRVNAIEDGFDVVFRIGAQEDSGLISQAIGPIPMSLYASTTYLENHEELVEPEDLLSHSCLVMSDQDRSSKWRLSRGSEVREVAVEARVAVNDFDSLKTLALSHVGITLLPDYLALEEVRCGLLQKVLPLWQGPTTELNAIYPSRRGATAKVREFIRKAQEHFRPFT